MRKISSLPLLLFFLASCEKEPVSVPVDFKETTYETLAPYDSLGKPSNLLQPRDNISQGMLSFIKSTLPEMGDLRKTNPELLKNKSIADIDITKSSEVIITFVSQVTDRTSAIGFYTYPTTTPPSKPEDIKTITYIFPNSGAHSALRAGDKVRIGSFEPGMSIGFVILPRAWDRTTKSLNNKAVHFLSNDVLNPEVDPNLKKHAVLVDYPQDGRILIAFEDVDRTDPTCDHDFNDVVLYATVK